MYYRVAFQVDSSPTWKWKSTVLSSLDTLFRWLRLYGALTQECLLVCSSSSREGLQEQLAQENQGLGSNAVTAAQFLRERLIHPPERMRSVAEREAGPQLEMVPIAVSIQQPFNERSREVNAPDRSGRGMSSLERRREDLESGAGGDHDFPYRFTLPVSTLQVLAWTKILVRVQHGELYP